MAFEKAKVIKAAEKFLSQGKISAAIKEYRQIIKHDPDDLTTLNMLGDLLARAGEKEEAATCFLRIAEHYREREFRLKAIAMYRKIEKLKPRDPVIAKELGDLYSAHGLIAEARAQYLVVADAATRAGQTRESLKVLHTIADLDPYNTDVRLKLAEGYLKENMQPEAARAFSEAASRLLDNGQFEKSLEAYAKARELRPNDRDVLKGIVSAHVSLGTADEAAELLEQAVRDEPDDQELTSMLAQAYIEAEDAAGAERATALLMSQDASHYRRQIEVARLYLKLGQEDEAARILGSIVERMLAGREENDVQELLDELLAHNPEHVPGLRLLARLHWWQRDMEKLRGVLERLAESAEALGLADDERYALTQLVRLAPEEHRYVDRLEALGGSLEDAAESSGLDDPPALEFESFGITEPQAEVSREPKAEAFDFEWNSVAGEISSPSLSFADLNEPAEPAAADPFAAVEPLSQPDPFAAELETAANNGSADTAAAVNEAQPQSVQAMMRHELESVDFYITQGYYDIGFDTLELLERQFGTHPEIDERRKKLESATHTPQSGEVVAETTREDSAPAVESEAAVEVVFDDLVVDDAPAAPSPTVTAPSGLDTGLAEIFEEFRMEAEGETADANEDYETHYNMATAYKEMDLLDEAIREFQLAAGLTSAGDGTPRYFHCCNLLGHCFVQKGMPQAAVIWFKKGLEVPGRNAEELKALQYELGSAYEEMGDVNRAVAAFTEVYGVDVSYRDIGERLATLQRRAQEKKNKKGKS
ncbi:MAG TPA: tetratricopeptide repeat protein [Pyrinomonadaceae bacterium]|jgi:tetratricopeptide (TPR) repeat protein